MAEQDVVVLRQEARRRRGIGVGAGRIGNVEELATTLVAERLEPGPQPLHDLAQTSQTRPRLDVHHRCRPEGAQIADDQLVDRRLLGQRPAEPGLHRGPRHWPGAAPQPAWRDVDHRHEVADGVCERIGRDVGPALAEQTGELRARARPDLDELATGGQDLAEVGPGDRLAERARPIASPEHRLDERSQRQRVIGGHQVDGRAHQ